MTWLFWQKASISVLRCCANATKRNYVRTSQMKAGMTLPLSSGSTFASMVIRLNLKSRRNS